MTEMNNNSAANPPTLLELLLSGSDQETYMEELANSVTHFLGLLLSACGMYYLLLLVSRNRRSWEHVVGCIVYGLSLLILYICSTLYHTVGVLSSARKLDFQQLDHAAIYVMIAGTYTPLTLINLIKHGQRKTMGFGLLTFVWLIAVVGIGVKVFLGVDSVPEEVGVACYLMMGWLAVLFGKPFLKVLPGATLKWIAFGGLSYSVGTFWLLWDALHFNHAVWHLFVMTGSACHFIAVVLCTIPVSHAAHKTSKDTRSTLSYIFSLQPKAE